GERAEEDKLILESFGCEYCVVKNSAKLVCAAPDKEWRKFISAKLDPTAGASIPRPETKEWNCLIPIREENPCSFCYRGRTRPRDCRSAKSSSPAVPPSTSA